MPGILLSRVGHREVPRNLVRDEADKDQDRRINLSGGYFGREGNGGFACHGMTMTGYRKTG